MLAMFHATTRAPRIRAHCNIDDIGISAAYIDRIDSLLKHTVAFHSIEKDIIPYNGKKVRNVNTGGACSWSHLEEERCRLRSKTLVDLCCVEPKTAICD